LDDDELMAELEGMDEDVQTKSTSHKSSNAPQAIAQ